jgi:hypothetical protein
MTSTSIVLVNVRTETWGYTCVVMTSMLMFGGSLYTIEMTFTSKKDVGQLQMDWHQLHMSQKCRRPEEDAAMGDVSPSSLICRHYHHVHHIDENLWPLGSSLSHMYIHGTIYIYMGRLGDKWYTTKNWVGTSQMDWHQLHMSQERKRLEEDAAMQRQCQLHVGGEPLLSAWR